MRRLLLLRDARVLLAGETLSMFGDRAMFLVLAIWAKSLTGSNAAAGLVFFAIVVPTLGAPLGGLIVDRVSRRRLMIAIDLLIAPVMLLLFFVHDRGDVWLIYLVAVLYGASSSIFASAQSALLTVMLPADLLGEANAVFQTTREGLRLIAPLAGAGLYSAFGGSTVAAIDAATFCCSALALASLRTREVPAAPREHHLLRELAAGVVHVRRTPRLRQIILATAVAFLVIGFAETLIFAVLQQGLHRPPSFFGVLGAVQGVGAIVGGLTAGRMLRRLGDGRLVGLGIALFAVGDALFAVPSLAVVMAGMVLAGAGLSWGIVGFGTAIQLRSPAHLQGRVYSAADVLVGTPQTISIALGAVLSTVFDYRALLVFMAVVMGACGIYLLTRRSLVPSPVPTPA